MSENQAYRVQPYDPSHAAGLAVMWNESDDEWPGTFTRGVPFTEERILKWLKDEETLLRLVVQRADGFVAGYGALREEPGQEGMGCYVALLNVHPAHQGRSLCRRMLTQMVDWATAHGYHRLTIGTWSGNLKSVPLYKKVGFYWTPDTSVGMENYIPAVRRLPAAQAFFAQAAWYEDYRRELQQVEDDQRHPATGQMKVYVARWERDGRVLEAIFDRLGQCLTGLETDDFAVYAAVDESKPAQGLRYAIRWQIENKRAEPVTVQLQAEGDEGIRVAQRESFTLAAGERRTVTGSFVCVESAPALDLLSQHRPKPAPRIHSRLMIGNMPVELATGLKYRPPVSISLHPAVPTLLPGRPQTVLVQVQNRLAQPLTGTLQITGGDEIAADWREKEFQVDAHSFTALPLTLNCAEPGAAVPALSATFSHEGQTVTTTPVEIAILCRPPGGVAAAQAGTDLHIENDFFKITARQKGGWFKVWNQAGYYPNVWFREEIGPPFSPDDVVKRPYQMALESAVGYAKATLRVASGRFPGLYLSRDVTLTASPLMQVQWRLENQSEQPYTVKVSLLMGLVDLDFQNARTTVPRQERLVNGLAADFPMRHNDLPHEPAGMAEQWLAYEVDGQVHGVVWPTDVTEHTAAWGNLSLHSAEYQLAPGETVTLSPVYLYCGPGSWQDVRRVWRRLADHRETQYGTPPIGPAQQARLTPSPVLTVTDRATARVEIDSVREVALDGRLSLESPAGWTADTAEWAVEGVVHGRPLSVPVTFTSHSGHVGPATGRLRLETEAFDKTYPFSLIRLGRAGTAVTTQLVPVDGDQALVQLANGRCQWDIAPDYHGGIVAWREVGHSGDGETNHLLTLFPRQDGAFSGFNPWFGGIQPTLRDEVDNFANWPGKFYEEAFTAAPVTATGEAGIAWQGVRVSAGLRRPGFEGLRVEIDYLTVGASNVLKVVFRVCNETAVYRTAVPGLQAFFQVDGVYQNATLYTDGTHNKRTIHHQWTWQGKWSAVANPETGRAVALVSASGLRRTFWLDWGEDGGHLMLEDNVTLPPNGRHELVAYLALAESVAEASAYGVM